MSKLKPGDKVTLRKGLKVGEIYEELTLYPPMVFDGETTVRKINNGYIETDNVGIFYPWCYSRYMLKKVNK